MNTELAEILLRLKALESLLIKLKIFSQDQLNEEKADISKNILKDILIKAKVPGDIDALVNSLSEIYKI